MNTLQYEFAAYKPKPIREKELHLGGGNPSGGSITLNSQFFLRDGSPWLPVMGEFHFSRCSRADWARELCKIRAGGVTVVSSYVFWIHHEETEGVFDFSGSNDLRAFVEECRKAGLDVLLRIGPWAHGECRNGGFPDWLLKKPFPLRENNTGYLALVKTLYQKIAEQVQGLLYGEGGNIIGIQLENEYVGNAAHLAMLKQIARECGLNVPLYTVTGWSSGDGAKIPVDEVVPMFGGYCDAPWDPHQRQNPPSPHYSFHALRNDAAIGKDQIGQQAPDAWHLPYEKYPFATCELGSGLQGTHHRRYIVRPLDIYTMALVKLGDGCNLLGYYMYHGGTNPIGKNSTLQESRASGYPNDYPILSYDFQAPISEFGEIRGHYRLLNLLHLFVQDFGPALAAMSYTAAAGPAPAAEDAQTLRYGMRTDGHSGFVFVSHYQRLLRLQDVPAAAFCAQGVQFPAIPVCGETSFFLPFRLKMGQRELEYATAQPICRQGDTWFFAALPGIPAEYRFAGETPMSVVPGLAGRLTAGGQTIVTLRWEQAQYLRRLNGALYLGDGCDLYWQDGTVRCAQEGRWQAQKWTGSSFEKIEGGAEQPAAECRFTPVSGPDFVPAEEAQAELAIGGARRVVWKRVSVSSPSGFVQIPDAGDVTQLYTDGILAADNYYYGVPWRVPAALLYGKTCFLAVSEERSDFYREF